MNDVRKLVDDVHTLKMENRALFEEKYHLTSSAYLLFNVINPRPTVKIKARPHINTNYRIHKKIS